MKRSLSLLVAALLSTPFLYAQDAAAPTAATDQAFFGENGEIIAANLPTSIPLKDRKPIEYNNPRADDVVWQKVIYRVVDLREKINFPLYFPEEADDNRQSLFTTIFRLMEEDKIKAYAYTDNREVFNEQERVLFSEILEKLDVLITVETDSVTGDTLSTSIDESNIPNKEILKYYMKEVWYFDKNNSVMNVRILAICPIAYRLDYETGKTDKKPLCWFPFDQLRPYLAQQEALISDHNNGARETMDDLFIKRRFGSYIYKESTTRNRNLLEYNATAEDTRKEQERIKTTLFNFEQDLWEY